MGFSHAAAGGIVFLAAMMTGFHVSDAIYDDQDEVAAAWGSYHDDQQALASTEFTIDSVTRFGQSRTEVAITNVGATTIGADSVLLLYDGSLQDVRGRVVDGTTSNLWTPQAVLVLETAAMNPTSVVVVDSHGVKAFWRA